MRNQSAGSPDTDAIKDVEDLGSILSTCSISIPAVSSFYNFAGFALIPLDRYMKGSQVKGALNHVRILNLLRKTPKGDEFSRALLHPCLPFAWQFSFSVHRRVGSNEASFARS